MNWRKIWKVVLISFGAIVVLLVIFVALFIYKARFGFPFYDSTPPKIEMDDSGFSVLIFNKTNGFRHSDAIDVSTTAFDQMAEENSWSIFQTNNGAIFNADDLAKFDVVVWNNVTGRVLKDEQKIAFKNYMEVDGGGFVGIHGAGDNSHHWPWYEETLLGANFSHHTLKPQFQEATMHLECDTSALIDCHHLSPRLTRSDEWYVFYNNPRHNGFEVLYTVDESTINPDGNIKFLASGKDFGMGDDHPIVWYKGLPGGGRTLYSALGHAGQHFQEQAHLDILESAIRWAGKLQ